MELDIDFSETLEASQINEKKSALKQEKDFASAVPLDTSFIEPFKNLPNFAEMSVLNIDMKDHSHVTLENGKLKEYRTASGILFTYHNNGNVKSKSFCRHIHNPKHIEYDEQGLKTSETFESGTQIHYKDGKIDKLELANSTNKEEIMQLVKIAQKENFTEEFKTYLKNRIGERSTKDHTPTISHESKVLIKDYLLKNRYRNS